MFKNIDENIIVDTISNNELRLKQLQQQTIECLDLLQENKHSVLHAVAIQNVYIDATNVDSTSTLDIGDVYDKYKQMSQKNYRDLCLRMRNIAEEIETRNRIMATYNILPAKEKEVMETIYKTCDCHLKMTERVDVVAKEKEITRSSVFRIRRNAIEHIMEIYDSDFTQREIYNQDFHYKPHYR